jgi:hypothetical protein
MTTENESSAAPEEAAAPAPVVGSVEQQVQQKPPAHAPMAGTKYVMNPKTGLYDVHRVDDEGQTTVDKGEDDLPEEGKDEPNAGEPTLEIPGHVPQSVQYDESIQGALHELGGILRESSIAPEVGQSYVDVYAEYAMEHPATEVDPANPGAVHAQLKALWGETYGTRWGHVLKAWNGLSPKSQEWVAYNAQHPIAMFRTLAAIGSGTFKLSREQAQAALDKMRSERTVTGKDGKPKPAPLYDVSHPDHRLVRDTYRNLSLVANREGKAPKEDQGTASLKRMVANRSDAERQAKGETVDAATEKMNDRVRAIRNDPNYWKKDNAGLHKSLVDEMQSLMRQLHGDD